MDQLRQRNAAFTLGLAGLGVVCSLVTAPVFAQADWKPAEAPLMTPWAEDVDPQDPLPEYPRPQLRRDDWQNLNGLWNLKFAGQDDDLSSPPQDGYDRTILVPFPIESALSGVGEGVPNHRAWYQREFEVPGDWTENNGKVLLNFGAVDWESHVYVNGTKVGEHQGGFDPFSFDVTSALQDGKNTISVGVFDPTSTGQQPRGKQQIDPSGIFYTPVTGIWQTVWLEPVPETYIENIDVNPDLENNQVRVTVKAPEGTDVEIEADGQTASGKAGQEIVLKMEDPELWSPSDPHLYDLSVKLVRDDETIDEIESYFGMRSIGLGRDEETGRVTSLTLNGKPLFQVGPLDQGWWPDGLYTAPTDEALKYDIEITKELGFNMIRKHVKVEPARWYYHADQLGVLVWQDMPSPHETTQVEEDVRVEPEMAQTYEKELREMMADFDHFPSIIMWVVFNEGWGQHETERYTKLAKELDPSRLISNASGWTDRNVGDILDIHSYPEPAMKPLEDDRAVVVGEFGGLGLVAREHMWQPDRLFQYRGMESSEALTEGYEKLFREIYELRQDGLAAAVYTQTTDVEGEINGLLTYDRKEIKIDQDRIRRANLGQLELETLEPLLDVASGGVQGEGEAPTWHYTTDAPKSGWQNPQTNVDDWKTGKSGFGTRQTPGSRVNTEWSSSDIWLRTDVELTKEQLEGDLAWRIHHDEDVRVYINGTLALRKDGFVGNYVTLPLSDEAKSALKEGNNTIAVHVHQTEGGQYIDLGLVRVQRYPNPMSREDAED